MNKKSIKRLSLTQHFDAPDAWIGHFGWLCGYSADAAFMDDAIERFTGQTHARRAGIGRISLAMMLDDGNPMVSTLDVPGLMHLPMRAAAARPFRLLHAKVALLGYRDPMDASRWLVRLIVSTGNWTRQTLEESLDLAFCIDVSSERIGNDNEGVGQDCADIHAAWQLMTWLKPNFDCRMIGSQGSASPGEAADADALLSKWIDACGRKARGETARFFDNRTLSFLAQLPAKIDQATSGAKCNRLAMGSGFFESAADGAQPRAVMSIIDALKDRGHIAQGGEIDLFVNPNACQAVAQAVEELAERGVTVRRAHTPVEVFGNSNETARALHAKFIFAAKQLKNSNDCTRAWLYLGSGNLTHAGFIAKASRAGGNLEAGVLFAAPGLRWKAGRGVPPASVVSNVLPIHPDGTVLSEASLSAGQEMPPRPPAYLAAPIAWVSACAIGDGIELRPSEPMESVPDLVVVDQNRQPCARSATGFIWPGVQPRMVNVQWQENGASHSALVPVIDEFGRVAATSLTALDIDEVWWQLANFPLAPDHDTPDGFGEGGDAVGGAGAGQSAATGRTYPIRQMMELIENIAHRQTQIDEEDWNAWCNRLEQTLSRAANQPGVIAFAQLGLNPLASLRTKPFRPAFAETADEPPGIRYEAVLARIEHAWGVASCIALGSNE